MIFMVTFASDDRVKLPTQRKPFFFNSFNISLSLYRNLSLTSIIYPAPPPITSIQHARTHARTHARKFKCTSLDTNLHMTHSYTVFKQE